MRATDTMDSDQTFTTGEDPSWRLRVRSALINWYGQGHRDLPWRGRHDAYRILVSETMLVQTTVAAVIPYFERFLARFPTVEALAEADEADVLKAWEGLGYYRRARQLHEAARLIVRDHGAIIPDDPDDLIALPGVGRYIAGAVLSFAFDRPAPIVEANTRRVLARLLAWPEDLSKSNSQKILWRTAENLAQGDSPGLFNQAFMELGATICTPRNPSCLICPISTDCAARVRGLQDRLPVQGAKASPIEVVEATALVVRDGKFLVLRRGPGRLWEGFWEFPTIHVSGADPARRAFDPPLGLDEGVQRLTGVSVASGPPVKTVRFGVTKHRVTLTMHHAKDCSGREIPDSGFSDVAWRTSAELSGLAMGSAMRKVANWAGSAAEIA
jgi:A/G-specific adenine glycosylase